MKTNTLIFPEKLHIERISYLIHQKGIAPTIAEIDLEMVKMKLREPEEGEGWTAEQCDSAEIEYKRYLHLCKKYGKGIVPNKIMDTVWHYHILDTPAYQADCQQIFGYFLHHYPYFGLRGEEDAQNLQISFEQTKIHYEEAFGEAIDRAEHTGCWHNCQNTCWHACSSK
jgi:hypothetical protein